MGLPEGARAWTTVDKSAWGEGAWLTEPDKVQWIDPETDLDCLAVRNKGNGTWCGYVGVPTDHPMHGESYQELEEDLEVHGGLSFAGACRESDDPSQGICHIPESGRPDHVWWVGFDCAHAFDLCPGYRAFFRGIDHPRHSSPPSQWEDVYRDLDYLIAECASLAKQVSATAQSKEVEPSSA